MGDKEHNSGRKIRTGVWYLLSHFTRKQRVSIRERGNNDREVWYIYISPMRITLTVLGVLIVMFAIVVTGVVYTPVLDALPGYPGRKAREMLTENIMRIDSLEYRMRIMQEYCNNVALIMEGGVPVLHDAAVRGDSLVRDREVVVPSRADSLLRAQIEGTGRFALVPSASLPAGSAVTRTEFVAPIEGVVVQRFEPLAGMPGMGIVPDRSQQVVATQAGTVVMSQWTPEDGNTIEIQHNNGYISFYKHNTQLLKKVGERVTAGEAIAYMERADSVAVLQSEFIFELWNNGMPVDPQQYVIFR